MTALPPIPVIDARDTGPVGAAQASECRMEALLADAYRLVPPAIFRITDPISRKWLARAGNPYLDEIDAIAALIGRPGTYTLNTSFEWGCTCGVGNDPEGGVRLLRVLDWGQQGLGRGLIVLRQKGAAGDFFSITWPGFVGIATAMAPGRFALALNQPPMKTSGLAMPIGWAAARLGVWQSRALPPSHLLRQVCETCANYDEARHALLTTPLCLPALFTLAGTDAGQGCIIERTEHEAASRALPAAVANHWVAMPRRGKPRGPASRERQALMEQAVTNAGPWAAEPIINRDTRFVATMNPARGLLSVQGWEREGPVTALLTL
jgi:hypothetical protein